MIFLVFWSLIRLAYKAAISLLNLEKGRHWNRCIMKIAARHMTWLSWKFKLNAWQIHDDFPYSCKPIYWNLKGTQVFSFWSMCQAHVTTLMLAWLHLPRGFAWLRFLYFVEWCHRVLDLRYHNYFYKKIFLKVFAFTLQGSHIHICHGKCTQNMVNVSNIHLWKWQIARLIVLVEPFG